jgi:tryptophan synthase alpha chain
MNPTLWQVFQKAQDSKQALFFPYICLGYPDYAVSLACARAALKAGAAGLELGLPFSDPIADGPTLQRATQKALQQGTKPRDVFRLIRTLRRERFIQPLLVMSYANLVEQMGWESFCRHLKQAGGNGAIIPDLPLEKYVQTGRAFVKRDLALIPFVAPTSNPQRVKMADALKAPFLYYVSVTGVTGARKTLPAGLLRDLRKLKKSLRTPLVAGFGISNPTQAFQVGRVADGVIIASALIQLISKTPKSRIPKAVERFCRQVIKKLSQARREKLGVHFNS